MVKAEEVGVSVLRGTAEVSGNWPEPGSSWTAMAVWRQEPVGAVLVGRRPKQGEVFYDVVVCIHDGDDWSVQGSGGSSVDPMPMPMSSPTSDKVDWFFTQDIGFEQEDGEDAYVWTAVGATSDGRPALIGTIRQDDEETPIQLR